MEVPSGGFSSLSPTTLASMAESANSCHPVCRACRSDALSAAFGAVSPEPWVAERRRRALRNRLGEAQAAGRPPTRWGGPRAKGGAKSAPRASETVVFSDFFRVSRARRGRGSAPLSPPCLGVPGDPGPSGGPRRPRPGRRRHPSAGASAARAPSAGSPGGRKRLRVSAAREARGWLPPPPCEIPSRATGRLPPSRMYEAAGGCRRLVSDASGPPWAGFRGERPRFLGGQGLFPPLP